MQFINSPKNKNLILYTFIILIPLNGIVITISNLNLYSNLIIINIMFVYMFIKQKCLLKTKFLFFSIFLILISILNIISSSSPQSSAVYALQVFVILQSYYCFSSIQLDNEKILTYLLFAIVISTFRVIMSDYSSLFPITIHNRFNVDFLGSVNNYSYILAMGIIIAVFLLKKRSITILYLLFFILISLSRGALFSLLFCAIIYFLLHINNILKKFNLKYLMIPCVSILILIFYSNSIVLVIQRRLISTLTDPSGGSGRITIWKYAINETFNKNLKVLFCGNGAKTFKYFLYNMKDSIHNQYIDVFFSYGIIFGIIIIVCYFIYFYKIVYKIRYRFETLFYINILYAISFIFDSRIWVIQTNWIFGLIVALTFKEYHNNKKKNSTYENCNST
jgi:hypothetical protein